MIALVALRGDCDDWNEVEIFGRVHEAWFKRFLKLPASVPSHDTFAWLFARLDPGHMNSYFGAWMSHLYQAITVERKTIAIDGKTLPPRGPELHDCAAKCQDHAPHRPSRGCTPRTRSSPN